MKLEMDRLNNDQCIYKEIHKKKRKCMGKYKIKGAAKLQKGLKSCFYPSVLNEVTNGLNYEVK